MNKLNLKDSSRRLQLNCVINYFLTTFNALYIYSKIRCDGHCRKIFVNKQGLLIIGSIHLACGDTFTRDTFSLSTTPAICHGYNHFSEEEDDSGGNCCGCISDASCGASSLLAACLAWFALRSTCLCVVVHWSGSWILVGILIILTLGFVCTDLEEGAVACGMCTSALT